MKTLKAASVICFSLLVFVTGCGRISEQGQEATEVSSPAAASAGQEQGYSDGVYRGFFYESDIEQISVQFELKDEKFADMTLRSIKYKDGNYLSEEATDIQRQIAKQYKRAASYLIGKEVKALKDLEDSNLVADDMDAVTSATLNTDKLEEAIKDGLSRNVFRLLPTSVIYPMAECEDGYYEGVYNDGGVEQIAVEFHIKENKFEDVSYRSLNYGDRDYLDGQSGSISKQIASQYQDAADYLEGKDISALEDLYSPGGLLKNYDGATSATLKTNKLISAINDGFAQGPKAEK